ncbi:hypothetical protein ACLB2K_064418 [Fragaria x ananassa]
MQSFISITLAFFFLFGALDAYPYPITYDPQQDVVSRTITVHKHGRGDFSSVQQAIDSIPSNNHVWTRILINSGVYVEKVEIPQDKPYIIIEGNPNRFAHFPQFPVIEFETDAGDVVKSPAFKLHADNYVARNIVFKLYASNQPIEDGESTYSTAKFFKFVLRTGQGLLTVVRLNITISILDVRPSRASIGKEGKKIMLQGSVQRNESKAPGSVWSYLTAFSEVDCRGPGARMSHRVPWEKKLTANEASYFSNAAYSFINQDGWMQKQPK